MSNIKENIFKAARAEHIPEGSSGLWYIKKLNIKRHRLTWRNDKVVTLSPGVITYLYRYTMEKADNGGEIVMEDTIYELRKHLSIMLKAYGNVLVTGLGLGCVIRGLLANPKVEHVTCIEKSQDVLNLVASYMPKEKLTIIHADALEWVKDCGKYDCAWHDLWTNREEGEPHLSVWHSKLITHCIKKVELQGAWAFPREMKTVYNNHGIELI